MAVTFYEWPEMMVLRAWPGASPLTLIDGRVMPCVYAVSELRDAAEYTELAEAWCVLSTGLGGVHAPIGFSGLPSLALYNAFGAYCGHVAPTWAVAVARAYYFDSDTLLAEDYRRAAWRMSADDRRALGGVYLLDPVNLQGVRAVLDARIEGCAP